MGENRTSTTSLPDGLGELEDDARGWDSAEVKAAGAVVGLFDELLEDGSCTWRSSGADREDAGGEAVAAAAAALLMYSVVSRRTSLL